VNALRSLSFINSPPNVRTTHYMLKVSFSEQLFATLKFHALLVLVTFLHDPCWNAGFAKACLDFQEQPFLLWCPFFLMTIGSCIVVVLKLCSAEQRASKTLCLYDETGRYNLGNFNPIYVFSSSFLWIIGAGFIFSVIPKWRHIVFHKCAYVLYSLKQNETKLNFILYPTINIYFTEVLLYFTFSHVGFTLTKCEYRSCKLYNCYGCS
jgi:hypothetical protein